ncbi:hypothetical protein HDE68_004870 [Pedobacter cryoconitis]|uniref:SMODS and SLOG-associating 2TM effector domain-containing protein n=1 Tax=Pedobacter cryoconitis TaxID=188932 RepID=A0A7W9E0Y8_9SPHI|nr:hypothetical protein [Pedobacter cryoconitis]MBB5638932.1 hypothetical protein [Pedobacter cryoconitis]
MKSPNYSLKTRLNDIREFFWPLLEIEKPSPSAKEPTPFKLQIDEENIDQFLVLTNKINDAEEDRRKGIESKAALFISTISVATSIVVAANSMVISNSTFGFHIMVSVFISFVLSIYAVRTVWFAVKALERGNYFVLGLKEINFKGSKVNFQKHLVNCLVKNKKLNQSTINSKADNMMMAQEYYKRAIIMISLFSLHVLIQCTLKYFVS